MNGRDFLEVARQGVNGPTEAFWRAGFIHAYYALVLECRDAQIRWGLAIPPRQNMHSVVRLRLTYASDPDLRLIGRVLDDLVQSRNRASYHLGPFAQFASATAASKAIQNAADALGLLDAIDADPARRATAIAAIRP